MRDSKNIFCAPNANDQIGQEFKNGDKEKQRDDVKELHVHEKIAREPNRPQRHRSSDCYPRCRHSNAEQTGAKGQRVEMLAGCDKIRETGSGDNGIWIDVKDQAITGSKW